MYQPIRNKNCPWRPRLLTDPNEMGNRYKVPPMLHTNINPFVQAVSEEKIFNVSAKLPVAAMFVDGSEPNEQP